MAVELVYVVSSAVLGGDRPLRSGSFEEAISDIDLLRRSQ